MKSDFDVSFQVMPSSLSHFASAHIIICHLCQRSYHYLLSPPHTCGRRLRWPGHFLSLSRRRPSLFEPVEFGTLSPTINLVWDLHLRLRSHPCCLVLIRKINRDGWCRLRDDLINPAALILTSCAYATEALKRFLTRPHEKSSEPRRPPWPKR